MLVGTNSTGGLVDVAEKSAIVDFVVALLSADSLTSNTVSMIVVVLEAGVIQPSGSTVGVSDGGSYGSTNGCISIN